MSMKCALNALPLLAILMGACDTNCHVGEGDPVRFAGGELTGNFYQTSNVDGRLLFFPADRRYDIVHGLGTDQLAVNLYLSFDERGATEDDVAPSAGNQATIERIDAETIRVHNDTCSQFYLRLTAQAPNTSAPNDAGSD